MGPATGDVGLSLKGQVMSEEFSTDRRRFLVGGATAAGAMGLGGTLVAGQETLALASSASVVLHDPRLELSEDVAARIAANGTRVIALTDDPVRLWRSEIGELLREPDTRLFGLTRWADFLIVRGLAAESRRHVRHERLDEASGALVWLIA
jgi:hypothetical protein